MKCSLDPYNSSNAFFLSGKRCIFYFRASRGLLALISSERFISSDASSCRSLDLSPIRNISLCKSLKGDCSAHFID